MLTLAARITHNFYVVPDFKIVKHPRTWWLVVSLAAVLWLASARPWVLGAVPSTPPWPAPQFTHEQNRDWINSAPLKLGDLAGQVVVIDFWTYGCWNCRRSLPWLKTLRERYADQGLRVIGVHTPEFKHESQRARIEEHVAELGIEHPVMIDNDFSYWDAMENRHWPTFYLVDKSGRVRERIIGEVRPGDTRAGSIEATIRRLLAETV